MTRISSFSTNLYAAIVHLLFSPVALCLQVFPGGLFRPEALGSPAGYVVPPGLRLLRPHEPLSVSPTGLSISSRRVLVLRSDRDGYREVPQFTPRVSLPVPSSVPRQSNGAPTVSSPPALAFAFSAQAQHLQKLPAGSLWVGCVFGAATFALCYGPGSCLLFTGKSFYFRAFASWGRPQGASSITIRPNSQLPEPDFHRQDTQHYGLRAEGAESAENEEERNNGIAEKWDKKMPKPIIPSFQYSNFPMVFRFHHSNIPAFQFFCSVNSVPSVAKNRRNNEKDSAGE